jgi:hypothetical protein
MRYGKMLGKLGWRGQCSCCNAPKDKKAIKQEEKGAFAKYCDEVSKEIEEDKPRRDADFARQIY